MAKRKLKLEVLQNEDEVPPAVCYFPTGLEGLAPNRALQAFGHAESDHFMVIRDQAEAHYVGSTMKEATEDHFVPCRLALGVYEKKKAKVSLLPILGDQIMRMVPRLKNVDYGKSTSTTSFGEGRRNNWEGQKRVLMKFAGAKTKRAVQNFEQYRLDASQTANALDGLVSEIGKKAEEEGITRKQIMAAAHENLNIPPHDPDATLPQDAYKFEKICPPTLWDVLPYKKYIEAATNDEKERALQEDKVVSPYVLSRLEVLRTGNEADIKQRALILSYMGLLLRFLRIPRILDIGSEPSASQPIAMKHGLPSNGVLDLLLEMFYTTKRAKGLVRYEASPAQKDLVKSYIFVLALHVNDFKLEVLPLTNLRQEMGMAVQATIKLLMQLGCAVVQMQSDRFNKGYSAQLLRSVSDPPKTLRECFPNLDHNEYKRSR